jgi:hypothetical protein
MVANPRPAYRPPWGFPPFRRILYVLVTINYVVMLFLNMVCLFVGLTTRDACGPASSPVAGSDAVPSSAKLSSADCGASCGEGRHDAGCRTDVILMSFMDEEPWETRGEFHDQGDNV